LRKLERFKMSARRLTINDGFLTRATALYGYQTLITDATEKLGKTDISYDSLILSEAPAYFRSPVAIQTQMEELFEMQLEVENLANSKAVWLELDKKNATKLMNIICVGPPNCGKSSFVNTLFNSTRPLNLPRVGLKLAVTDRARLLSTQSRTPFLAGYKLPIGGSNCFIIWDNPGVTVSGTEDLKTVQRLLKYELVGRVATGVTMFAGNFIATRKSQYRSHVVLFFHKAENPDPNMPKPFVDQNERNLIRELQQAVLNMRPSESSRLPVEIKVIITHVDIIRDPATLDQIIEDLRLAFAFPDNVDYTVSIFKIHNYHSYNGKREYANELEALKVLKECFESVDAA
jgi:50S ribosome-binding GTPase